MKKLLSLIIVLMSFSVWAAPPTLTAVIEIPTLREDGEPLDDLQGFKFYCKEDPDQPFTLMLDSTEITQTTFTFPNCMTTEYGNAYVIVRAYNPGGEGLPSDVGIVMYKSSAVPGKPIIIYLGWTVPNVPGP